MVAVSVAKVDAGFMVSVDGHTVVVSAVEAERFSGELKAVEVEYSQWLDESIQKDEYDEGEVDPSYELSLFPGVFDGEDVQMISAAVRETVLGHVGAVAFLEKCREEAEAMFAGL